MIYQRINKQTKEPALVASIAGFLRRGRIAVLPTDTIYGLSGRADRPAVIKRIYRLKRRAAHKPLIILISSVAMLRKYAYLSEAQARVLRRLWAAGQRPTTVILRSRGALPKELSGGSDGLAIRLPKSKFLIKILRSLKVPLISTSLNLSGEPSLNDPRHLLKPASGFPGRLDLIIDAGPALRRKPSRLVDLRDSRQPKILRN